MSAIWYALWFIVAVSLLVTVHEFGHYWVARRLGFKVLRFSVGFGKPLFKRTAGRDQTEYVLAALPLGGYVKLLDEREGNVPAAELHRAFTRRPHWQRILVLLAGPAFNIAFAILLLWGMFWVSGISELRPVIGDITIDSPAARAGLQTGDEVLAIEGHRVAGQRDVIFGLLEAVSGTGTAALAVRGADGRERTARFAVPDPVERKRLTEPAQLFDGLGFRFWQPPIPAIIGRVEPGGPAAQAGLLPGDELLSVDGETVRDFRDVVARIAPAADRSVAISYRRDGQQATVRLTVDADEVDGRTVGRIRVNPASDVSYPDSMLLHTALGPVDAFARAAREAWDMTLLQARLFGRMLLGQVSLKNLSGPLSIAEFAGDSAQAGVSAFLGFLVLISLSLGFLNLLPIPILDGGQIVYQCIEWLKGSPLSERAQVFGQQLGIALLLLLMGVALYNDFARQLG